MPKQELRDEKIIEILTKLHDRYGPSFLSFSSIRDIKMKYAEEQSSDEDGRLGDRGRERKPFPVEEGLGEPWVPQVRMSPSKINQQIDLCAFFWLILSRFKT